MKSGETKRERVTALRNKPSNLRLIFFSSADKLSFDMNYSYLSAIIGSTLAALAARRAGT